ncbi:MAG TPA: L,D-transpeptidase family protein [Blastocatellia bacterium]|nr:L,D-transpeptidase family protein [Blastocatellia bacterium]
MRAAAAEKAARIKEMFRRKGINFPPDSILLRVFKRERVLELWARDSKADRFELVKQYAVCSSSGQLGPKRRQGDGQIPEGFYQVDRFNPVSNFHLSLGIDYPNRSDRILGGAGDLGGDIFIHGGCVTIGCVPITDEGIKELYLIAVEARSSGQTAIPVHIFPSRLDEAGMRRLEREYAGDGRLIEFWRNLKEGFDLFESRRKLPVVRVDRRARYAFGR